MTPAVIYAAKSTEDKHGSIPTQLADGRKLAAARDHSKVSVLSVASGAAFGRGDDAGGLYDRDAPPTRSLGPCRNDVSRDGCNRVLGKQQFDHHNHNAHSSGTIRSHAQRHSGRRDAHHQHDSHGQLSASRARQTRTPSVCGSLFLLVSGLRQWRKLPAGNKGADAIAFGNRQQEVRGVFRIVVNGDT